MAALARHGILSAPVLDEKNAHFHGFLSCLDILHAFVDGLDPALTRGSYVASCTREEDVGAGPRRRGLPRRPVHEDPNLARREARVRGHGDDATLLDVVSHGFFPAAATTAKSSGRRPACATIEPAAPLTSTQRDDRLEAAGGGVRDGGSSEPHPTTVPDFAAAAAIEARAFTRTVGVCHRVAVFEHDADADAARVVAIVSSSTFCGFSRAKWTR